MESDEKLKNKIEATERTLRVGMGAFVTIRTFTNLNGFKQIVGLTVNEPCPNHLMSMPEITLQLHKLDTAALHDLKLRIELDPDYTTKTSLQVLQDKIAEILEEKSNTTKPSHTTKEQDER